MTYRFGEEHQPITEKQVLHSCSLEDKKNELWMVYQHLQENLTKGELSGRNTKSK
ncbi:hypothetical protein HMPREF1568_1873 [Providencia alcalifaciens PAL-3]|nr:hypothetical protein HMPREF1568_1873 [Providencia alcalifaciens PAL-3]EUC98826.1 hypothetical protein HMPREF1566_1379 [Providencia alcalifaciens PAL-1]